MVGPLILAFVLCAVTVLMHALGTVCIVIPLAGLWQRKVGGAKAAWIIWALTRLVSLLLIVHLLEASVWAVAYMADSVFDDFETSFYYSITSYTTVGYGDALPSKDWRLLGPIEAAVGILMLGWSTSIIVAAVQYIVHLRAAHIGEGKTPGG